MDNELPDDDPARLEIERIAQDTTSSAIKSVKAFNALFEHAKTWVKLLITRSCFLTNRLLEESDWGKRAASEIKHVVTERLFREGANDCYANFGAGRDFNDAIVDFGSLEYHALGQLPAPPAPPQGDAHALADASGSPSAPPAEALAAPDGAATAAPAAAAAPPPPVLPSFVDYRQALLFAPPPDAGDAAEGAAGGGEADWTAGEGAAGEDYDWGWRDDMRGRCGNCPSCLEVRRRTSTSLAAVAPEEEGAAGVDVEPVDDLYVDTVTAATPPPPPKRKQETPPTLPVPDKRPRLDTSATAATLPAPFKYAEADGGAPGGVHGSDGYHTGSGGEVSTHRR